MIKQLAFSFTAWLVFLVASPLGAVEIPNGVTANCFAGVFGRNPLVRLEEATVPPWPEVKQRREVELGTVTLAFREAEAGETPEQIAIVYAVTDKDGDTLISRPMKATANASGTVRLVWDLQDAKGDRIGDGLYRVKMHIYGRHHGHLLTDALFPLYISTAAPVLSQPKLTGEKAVLEYGGGPTIGFTLNTAATVVISEMNDDGVEIDSSTSVFGAGPQSARPDLRDRDNELFEPGNYRVKVTARNDHGESEAFLYRYELNEPPPLEVEVRLDRMSKLQARDDNVTPFTVVLNQPAYIAVEHVDEYGNTDFIGKSTLARPAVLFKKGSHKMEWRRLNRDDNTRHTTGTHYIRVTAGSMTGEEEVAESEPIKLDAGPANMRRTRVDPQPMVEQLAIRRRPTVSVAATPDVFVVGGEMKSRITYSLNRPGHVRLGLYAGDRLVKLLVDTRNEPGEELEPDLYDYQLDASVLNPGLYRVVLDVDTEGYLQTVSATDFLNIVWRD